LIPNYVARLSGERVMHGKTFASLDIGRPEAVEASTTPAASSAAPAPAAPAAVPFVEFSLQSTAVQEAAK
jgi:hypothetical protein